MKTRKIFLTLLLALFAAGTWAQGPNNSGTYYKNADGLTGQALKTKLFAIISQKTNSPTYDDLLELYKKTDTRADGYVRDWYSNTTNFTHIVDKAGSYKKEGDVYNREHTVPQSWGAPKSDIVHVVPTDGYVNNRRGNFPFGEVGTITYQSNNGYSKLGTCKTSGYSDTVFEPNDEVKGDIARIYFYMATCYENTITTWSGGGVITGTKYQPYAQWTFDMLMRWSKLDPVDDVERGRNAAIAQSDVQGNRNPFVDYPGLEDYIWGSLKEVPFSYDNYQGGGEIVVPAIAQPVFSPQGGTFTDEVVVSMSSDTEGATIYYTTNNVDPSEQSEVYEGPITISTTTTLKAIAVKDGEKSYQTTAVYIIKSQSDPVDGTIALNSEFFNSATGVIANTNKTDLIGTQNGFTITYGLGTGVQRYCGTDHIRMYSGNTLTISADDGTLSMLEFELKENTTKRLSADVGMVNDLIWVGNAQSVTFSVDSGSGHAKIKSVNVTTTATDIEQTLSQAVDRQVFYDLQGRQVTNPTKGLYIMNGRKVIVK